MILIQQNERMSHCASPGYAPATPPRVLTSPGYAPASPPAGRPFRTSPGYAPASPPPRRPPTPTPGRSATSPGYALGSPGAAQEEPIPWTAAGSGRRQNRKSSKEQREHAHLLYARRRLVCATRDEEFRRC